jgi:hypothetical protein
MSEEETQTKMKCQKAKAAQAAAMANIKEMGNRFLAGTDIKDQVRHAPLQSGARSREPSGGLKLITLCVCFCVSLRQDDTELPPDSLECGAAACLYCHERTNSPLGYIGFVQKSTALAEALEKAPSHTGIGTR